MKTSRLLHIIMAAAISAASLSSCSTIRKSGKPVTSTQVSQDIRVSDLNKAQKALLREAEDWLGTPYEYAHMEKGKGADCSGFVMQVFDKALGAKLPRNSAKQAEFCIPLSPKDVRAGDLVFFATGKDKAKVSHVGIMVDAVRFIHCSSTKGVVISTMENSYFTRTFLMYGRVPPAALTQIAKR